MWVLRVLVVGLIAVSFSSGQEISDRSVPQDVGLTEIEVTEISEPSAAEIERAGNGDERSLAALEALKEGNDLWRAGLHDWILVTETQSLFGSSSRWAITGASASAANTKRRNLILHTG